MRNFSSILLFLLGIFSTASHAEEDLYTKKIVAHVDLTNQRMHVTIEGLSAHTWKISSGRSGYLTPTETYQPKFLHRMHYSRQYDNSPMPHSVFFFRGYAVHGTSYVKRLGRPASHGCIRLAKPHARKFFDLVKAFGKSETQIVLTGKAPGATRYVKKKREKKRHARKKSKQRRYYIAKKRKRALALKRKRQRTAARRKARNPLSFIFGD